MDVAWLPVLRKDGCCTQTGHSVLQLGASDVPRAEVGLDQRAGERLHAAAQRRHGVRSAGAAAMLRPFGTSWQQHLERAYRGQSLRFCFRTPSPFLCVSIYISLPPSLPSLPLHRPLLTPNITLNKNSRSIIAIRTVKFFPPPYLYDTAKCNSSLLMTKSATRCIF